VLAIDGNPGTFWHTQWSGAQPGHPHHLAIDLGEGVEMAGFTYLPRQDGRHEKGVIGAYEVYASAAGYPEVLQMTGVEIHPGGWVNFCAGLALGNVRHHPLNEILASYEPDAHPIIRVLAQDGPAGLLRLAQEYGYSSTRGYVDGCHLCYEARRFLRPYYSDHLAPARPYVS